MANSKTEIVNMALAKIGGGRVSNMETSTDEKAIWARTFFDSVRDAVLRYVAPQFARVRRELARSDHDTTDEWDYEYQLPSNPYCLRVLGIPDAPTAKYVIEGRKMLTSETSVDILYVKRAVNIPEYDSLFVMFLVDALASALAGPVAGSSRRSIELLQEAQQKLQMAQNIDGEEAGPHQNQIDKMNLDAQSSYWSFRNAGR